MANEEQSADKQQAEVSRRNFMGGLAAAGVLSSWTARSYAAIAGANDRVNFAVIGLNSRAYAHLSALQANRKDARITHVCDVDMTILNKFAARTQTAMNEPAQANQDFRRALESKNVDAITIATPDHWHTANGDHGSAGRQACLCRKALFLRPARRSDAD